MRSLCLNLLGRPLGLAVLLLLAGRAAGASGPRPPRLGKVLGADISFLPQLEARDDKLADRSGPKNTVLILQDVTVAEDSERRREVNDVAFNLPSGKDKDTFIWEPLNTEEAVFGEQDQPNDLLPI